jgi:hypothetical protein
MTCAANLSDYPSSHRVKYSTAFSEQIFNDVIAEGEANIEPERWCAVPCLLTSH